MSETSAFLQLYDDALPHVYGYLARRCTSTATAEDLTAETFMAAVSALRNANSNGDDDGDEPDLNIAWLIGTARHKLIDHWRRTETTQGRARRAVGRPGRPDPNDAAIEVATAHEVLAELAPHHRAVLTLRYLDDLPVGDVASTIGRTVHATEALLTRAKAAFRNHSRPAEERSSR